MVGGVRRVAFGLLILVANPESAANAFSQLVYHSAVLLTLAGLVGFHILQKGKLLRVRKESGILYSCRGICGSGVGRGGSFLGKQSSRMAHISSRGVGHGSRLVLYGAATLQAKVSPRWCD